MLGEDRFGILGCSKALRETFSTVTECKTKNRGWWDSSLCFRKEVWWGQMVQTSTFESHKIIHVLLPSYICHQVHSIRAISHLVAPHLFVWGFLWLSGPPVCCQGFLHLLLGWCGSCRSRLQWWCRGWWSCSCWIADWSPDSVRHAPRAVSASWVEVYSTPHDPWRWKRCTKEWSLR